MILLLWDIAWQIGRKKKNKAIRKGTDHWAKKNMQSI
jgi:hypothetical protein